MLESKPVASIRLISVASVFWHLKYVFARLMTTEANLFRRSPILWNIIRPRGMPTMAYAMQNAFPPMVTGVECPYP